MPRKTFHIETDKDLNADCVIIRTITPGPQIILELTRDGKESLHVSLNLTQANDIGYAILAIAELTRTEKRW